MRRSELVCLTDLFGIATCAAGKPEIREGVNLFDVLAGSAQPREITVGFRGLPGTDRSKIMVRHAWWKYIFFANGGCEQPFDVKDDLHELYNVATATPDVVAALKQQAVTACRPPSTRDALEGSDFKVFPFRKWEWKGERIYQFDRSKRASGFPVHPGDVLSTRFRTTLQRC